MNPLSKLVWKLSASARKKRAALFRSYFAVTENTKILDIGSEDGTNIHNVLTGTKYKCANVYVADIDANLIKKAEQKFGFVGILIDEDKPLPFPDKYFDIVYCSSVIEHVTLPKSDLWSMKNEGKFREASLIRQSEFAKEIARLGKQYFVQTPSKSFPIESHTWLPLVGFLPRNLLLPIMKVSNRLWVKSAEPDFNLLGEKEMLKLFPNSEVVKEKKFGFTKSIMTVKV